MSPKYNPGKASDSQWQRARVAPLGRPTISSTLAPLLLAHGVGALGAFVLAFPAFFGAALSVVGIVRSQGDRVTPVVRDGGSL